MKTRHVRTLMQGAVILATAAAAAGCAATPDGGAAGADESTATQSAAIGESTCATVDDVACTLTGGCFHAPYFGPATDGKGVAYKQGNEMAASSPDSSYTNGSQCSNAWITDVFDITDAPEFNRTVVSLPATLPTTSSACSATVQGTSVYYHEKGAAWGTWQQLGGPGAVFQTPGVWSSGKCTFTTTNVIPPLPQAGIDEVRVASYSFGAFFPIPTRAGIVEVQKFQ